jgi:hypothetical protein
MKGQLFGDQGVGRYMDALNIDWVLSVCSEYWHGVQRIIKNIITLLKFSDYIKSVEADKLIIYSDKSFCVSYETPIDLQA